MSKPKKYPPYRVKGSKSEKWIVDKNECDVVKYIEFSAHYHEVYADEIMQIICDAINKKEEQPIKVLVKEPKMGDTHYYVDLLADDGVSYFEFNGSVLDYDLIKRRVMFHDYESAKATADKLITYLQTITE